MPLVGNPLRFDRGLQIAKVYANMGEKRRGGMSVIRIAIVEDDCGAAELLSSYIQRYGDEMGEKFDITHYEDGASFLRSDPKSWQIIFMDIEMPGMDGMETSRRLREMDREAVLIFVTNLAQYAIEGYEVGALDFILKPVNYFSFKLKMGKAISAVRLRQREIFSVSNEGSVWYIKAAELCYVEVMGHNLIYHTVNGAFKTAGALKSEEKRLEGMGFFRCNYCYLVNLRYVSGIKGNTVTVHGEELEISRNRKKPFLERLSEFYGRGGM